MRPRKAVDSIVVQDTLAQPFRIHGARGSTPVSGDRFLRYGGETTCFSIESDDELLVIDAGTGLINLGTELTGRDKLPRVTLLFTHFHLDHVIGLPSFPLCYLPDAQIRFMCNPAVHPNWRKTLETLMGEPFWPANLTTSEADLRFEDLPQGGDQLTIGDLAVRSCPVPHPQGCVAFRVDGPNTSTVIATDVEYPSGPEDHFLEFCNDTDVLIYDAQYLPEEIAGYTGWGHSTWQDAVSTAKRTGARELILTHHAPTRTDDKLAAIEMLAIETFENTRVARPGLALGSTQG
tara:strand:- start:763 stop:1635 length:873 start_codon:yes stop_codon:yes gene_type:complete